MTVSRLDFPDHPRDPLPRPSDHRPGDYYVRQIASFSLTLVPAAYLLWSGRRLIRRIDDPAFPELRFGQGQWLAFVIAASFVLAWLVSGALPLLKAAILLLGVLVAGFPTRRALFEETWGLFAYLDHTLRFWAAGLGLWLLLALQPTLIRWSGDAALPAAIALFLGSLLYSHFNERLLPRLLRATELDDPKLEKRLRSMLRGARCAPPRLLRADAPGGRWVNAFALPSRQQPAVLFTADLLEALDPAETRAIFAHEIAHLEYFHPGRILQRELAVGLLAFAPLLVVLLYGPTSPALAAMTWIWPLVVLVFLATLVAHNQRREHESDLRALELVGEPGPLISALTRIHHLMKMPRRWGPDSEARMSHPSLARRLRAIRDAAASPGVVGHQGEADTEVVVASATDPGERVILASDRLIWLTGVDPTSHANADELLQTASDYRSMRYAVLRDLRLEARGSKRRQLIVVDSRGRTLKLPITPGDVEPVKGAIERVDLQVEGTGREAAQRYAKQMAQSRNLRILGILACLIAVLPPFSLPFLAAGVLVLVRASTVSLAAAGAIAFGAAFLAGRAPSVYLGGGPSPALSLMAGLLGILLFVAAFRRWRQKQPDEPGAGKPTLLTLTVLAILYSIAALGQLSGPLATTQLHLWTRQQPGLALVLLGLAAALFTLRSRLARLPAFAAGAAAAGLIVIGTPGFRNYMSDDALASAGRELSAPVWTPAKIRQLTIAGNVTELRLAPSGRRIAAHVYGSTTDHSRVPEWTFKIERRDGTLIDLQALDLEFLQDDRIAILQASPTGLLFLRTLDLEPEPEVHSEIHLPPLDLPTLRVDAAADRWEVAEADLYAGHAVLVTGHFGADGYRETRWTGLRPSDGSYISAVAMNARRQALVLSQRYGEMRFAPLMMMLAPGMAPPSVHEVGITADSQHARLAQTALPMWCVEPPAGETRFVCASNDFGSATHFWSIDAQAHRLSLIGSLSGAYYRGLLSANGSLLVGGYGSPPVLIQLSSGTARTLDLFGSRPVPELAGAVARSGEPPADMDGGEAAASFPALDQLLRGLFGTPSSGPFFEAMALSDRVLAVASRAGQSSTVSLYRLDGPEGRR